MTDFERIKSYYEKFDELGRLDKPEGRLEFEISFDLLLNHLNKGIIFWILAGVPVDIQ